MYKKLKAVLVFVLIMTMCGAPSAILSAAQTVAPSSGKVIEIIDGDAILVDSGGGCLAYVRLVGVDAMGRKDALEYLRSELLGATVSLFSDNSVLKDPLFHSMYVYKLFGGSYTTTVNELLLRFGLAKIRESDKYCGKIELLRIAEETARINKLGIWADNTQTGSYVYVSEYVNINLSSATVLAEKLDSVSYTLASRIVSRRSYAPFQKVSDVKFIDGVNSEVYEKNRYRMVVSTNINTASEDELLAISALSASDVERILNYRRSYSFTNINELVGKNLISASKFNTIMRFIDVVDRVEIIASNPDKRVNINTATRSQLMDTGLSSTFADYIVNNRSAYAAYLSLSELTAKSSSPFRLETVHNYADNLICLTDINKATQSEFESLLPDADSTLIYKILAAQPFSGLSGFENLLTASSYNAVKSYIYCGYRPLPVININLASDLQLQDAGFTTSQIIEIAKVRKKLWLPADLTFDLSSMNGKFTLQTNVNTATREELLTLSLSLDSEFIDNLIYYRDGQPFGNYTELYDFFVLHGKTSYYSSLRDFLVLR